MKCEFCEKEYRRSRIDNHTLHCKCNPNKTGYCCKYCNEEFSRPVEVSSHTSNCVINPNYDKILLSRHKNGKIGRKHTEESKKKISKARIKYLTENPDKVPYKLNHSSKESYPEKYFQELFIKEKIEVDRYFHIGLYELDFCILDKRIDIEIDGSQHIFDDKIVESDIRRTKFLEENDWDVIRINWSEYKKMNFGEKSMFIKDLKNYINTLSDEKPTIKYVKNRTGFNLCSCLGEKCSKSKKCLKCHRSINIDGDVKVVIPSKKGKCSCGNECSISVERCSECYNISNRRVVRPPLYVLLEEVKELGYVGTGRKYGVSDNSIRKWIKYYKSKMN